MDADIVIKGGTIFDGTGRPGYAGDVAVVGDRIAALGALDGMAARTTIDAAGRAVAPGFIDIHTHYDAQILWDRSLSISPWHGVTTAILGNCGFGLAPALPEHRDLIVRTLEKVEGMSATALRTGLGQDWPFETFPEYMEAIARGGIAINVGVLVGHTPTRIRAMGAEAADRTATGDEVAAMRRIVEDALAAGAMGFATSITPLHVGYDGKPVPSRLAAFDEILTLAGALADTGRGLTQIAVGGEVPFDAFVRIVEASGRPLTWTALLTRASQPGLHREHQRRSAELLAGGHAIVPQVSCRPLMTEFHFREPFTFERLDLFAQAGRLDVAGKRALFADPVFRAATRAVMEAPDAPIPVADLAGAWKKAVVSHCPAEPALEGRLVAEIAASAGTHALDYALDLSLETDFGTRFRVPAANADEDGVAELLADPNMVLGLSDAGAHASQLCDACFATDLLGRWVREKGALSLERAVQMLTERPAEVMGIADRGRLARGLAADIVVFDPETVGAGPLERVHDLPAGEDRLIAPAFGIDAVIVNGAVLEAAAPLSGRVLRPSAA